MPWLPVEDDVTTATEAMARVMARKKAMPKTSFGMVRPEPVPKPEPTKAKPKAKPKSPPPPPIKKPIAVRPNRDVPGFLINFLNFNKGGKLSSLTEPDEPYISMRSVFDNVVAYFDTTIDGLRAHCRDQESVLARQVAFYLCKKLTRNSFPEIGRRLCKDHSTVIHAVERMRALLLSEQQVKVKGEKMPLINVVKEIERRIRNGADPITDD